METRHRRFIFTVMVLSAVFVATRTEQYPDNFQRKTYFQRFEDLGMLAKMSRKSEYTKGISQLNHIISEQEFLGLDKILEFENSENRYFVVKNSFHRERRAVEKTSHVLSQTDVNTSNATSTLSDQTINSEGFTTTSGDFPNKTEPVATTRDLSSTVSSSSLPFSSTTEQFRTTTEASQTTQCALDTQRIFTGVSGGDQWSLQLVDSWGKPGAGLLLGQMKFVGNYHECRESIAPASNDTDSEGFSGNYCAVGLASTAALGKTFVTVLAGASIEIGACIPSTCSAEEIFSLFNQGLIAANLTSMFLVASVDCRNDYREYTAATIVSIIFMSFIAALMVLGTAFDILFVHVPKWAAAKKISDDSISRSKNLTNGYHPIGANDTNLEGGFLKEDKKHIVANGGDDYSGEKKGEVPSLPSERRPLLGKGPSESRKNKSCSGILSKVLLSFSVYTNGKKLLNTSQPQGSLGAIHGIRFLSMSWVILGHTYIFPTGNFVNLATAMPALLGRWTFDAVSNALVSVDTFFALSGLLTAYVTTKEIQKKGWKLNWAMFYFHRYWRLTPPYMLVLLVTLGLHRFLGSGALWSSNQPMDKVQCEDNWWTNMLYINNIVNSKQMCMGHTWYMANDMQFYILSPLMIVPFYFNIYAGLGSCLTFLLASWTTAGVLSTTNDWPNSLLNGAIPKEGSLDYQHYYYIAPYCRIGPFVIGILTGYLLAITKGQIRMKWYYIILGWAVAISVALASVYGIHGDITGENPSSVAMSAFYNAMARSAWGACICWVIVACVCGYGGPVNSILSWSPFVSLGRLTYIAYLIHPTVIRAYFENMDQLYYLNDTNFVISYLGVLIFTNMASFILVLGFESPMLGLEKIFLGRH